MRHYALSAQQGNSEDMNVLGYKYELATGVPKDIPRTTQWFCKAIAYGNPNAINNLAELLHDCTNVPHELAEARSLWRQSASLAHVTAAYTLGLSYLQEPQDERDPAQALRWIVQAAQGAAVKAQVLPRRNGYAAPLPRRIDEAARMIKAPHNTAGHANICGTPISSAT